MHGWIYLSPSPNIFSACILQDGNSTLNIEFIVVKLFNQRVCQLNTVVCTINIEVYFIEKLKKIQFLGRVWKPLVVMISNKLLKGQNLLIDVKQKIKNYEIQFFFNYAIGIICNGR
jgi:hypothetical protein